jgi:hypothetical protein
MSLSSLDTDLNPGASWGIIVWDATASSIKPSPQTDLNVDWMYHTFVTPGSSKTGAVLQAPAVPTSYLYNDGIDLKSRRRLHELNDKPFLVFFNEGSASVLWSVMVKMLIALP